MVVLFLKILIEAFHLLTSVRSIPAERCLTFYKLMRPSSGHEPLQLLHLMLKNEHLLHQHPDHDDVRTMLTPPVHIS